MNLQSVFERAFALQQNGQLAEAEGLYLQILRAAPNDFATLLLLGILCHAQGRNDEALKLIGAALELDANAELALLNYGNVLGALGRPGEALAVYDRTLMLHPTSVDAANNRGVLLWNMGRPGEALTSYDRALALHPGHAEAHNNRGNVLQDLGRAGDALASYRQALALRPDFAQALNNQANALRKLKRPEAALASADQALALAPHYADALYNRANILLDMTRLDDALAGFDAALALQPDNAEALNDRGNTLQELNRQEDAIKSYDAALAIRPDHLDAMNNRSNAWRGLHRFGEALEDLERVLAIAPGNAQAWWSKSIVKLQLGDLAEGLRLYEWRKRMPQPIEARGYAQPLWTGAEDIAGQTLFVYIEQGLGDSIQFYRYALMARARGARVILSVQDAAVRLIRDAGDDVKIIGWQDVPAHFDYHAPLMSLPLAFGTTLDTIPAATPYLRAEPERVSRWKDRLGEEGFKIGVCWQGAPTISGRSFALSCLEEISRLPGVRLISLQKGVGQALPAIETLGADFDAGADAFLDSAAVMQCLDLVITADTAIAHLAGALRRPVWVALKHLPDWRWFLGRSDSPWYPGMRLFRQNAPGDWAGVFAAIKAALVTELP